MEDLYLLIKQGITGITQLRNRGVSAYNLLIRPDIPILNLLYAGFSPAELRAGGVTAKALLANGQTVSQLRAAGYTAIELRRAGVKAENMLCVGFVLSELREAGYTVDSLPRMAVSARDLFLAGYTAKELVESYRAIDIVSAGFSRAECIGAGISPSVITMYCQ